jgi:hypothetical protein
MWKHALWISAALLGTAAIAVLVLRQATGHAHLRELAIVTAITVAASLAAMIPLALSGRSDPVVVFQAAFGGTIIHLFLTMAMGAAVHAMKWVDRSFFLFLLLGFYWFSLIFTVIAMIRTFRRSVPQRTAAAGSVPAKGS